MDFILLKPMLNLIFYLKLLIEHLGIFNEANRYFKICFMKN